MENVIINIIVSKNVYKIPKMQKTLYLFNSKSIVIKAMSLVVNFCHFNHPHHLMVHVHLVLLYGKMNYICSKLLLCGSMQFKSQPQN
jgi:hypothetical protein